MIAITINGTDYDVPSSAADTNWAARQVAFEQALAAAVNSAATDLSTIQSQILQLQNFCNPLLSDNSSVGNVGGVATDLHAYSISSVQLQGEGVVYSISGRLLNSGPSTIDLKVNSSTLLSFLIDGTIAAGGYWNAEMTVVTNGNNTQNYTVKVSASDGSSVSDGGALDGALKTGTLALTDGTSWTFKAVATNASSDNITGDMVLVRKVNILT